MENTVGNIINRMIEHLEDTYDINVHVEELDEENNNFIEISIQIDPNSNENPNSNEDTNQNLNEDTNQNLNEDPNSNESEELYSNEESELDPNERMPDLISHEEIVNEMILTGNYYDYLQFLSNTNYLINYNEDVLRHIEETTIPYLSQWDNLIDDHYKYMVKMLYEELFSAKDIFNNIGVYLILKSDSTFIEEDMNIVRKHIINYEIDLHNILRPIQNIFNNIFNMQIQEQEQEQDQDQEQTEDVKLIVPLEKLAELPIVNYGSINNSLNNSCSFCNEEFTIDTLVRVVKCSHIFHPECIDKWLCEYSYKCPNCREPACEYTADI
jgi:hypothetical protein